MASRFHAMVLLVTALALATSSACQREPSVSDSGAAIPPQSSGGSPCLSDADCSETFGSLPACRVSRCNPSTGGCFIDHALNGIPCAEAPAGQCNTTCQAGECVGSPCGALCANGLDDDGDGAIDCDDPSCQSESACADILCSPGFPLSCGASVTSSTLGVQASSSVDPSECTAWDVSGPEQVFQIPAGPALTLTASLVVKSADLRLLVYEVEDGAEECVQSACIAAGEDSVQWEALPETSYQLHVDGPQGSAGAFALSFACHASSEAVCNNGEDEDADGEIDCEDPDSQEDPACVGCVAIAPLGCGPTLSAPPLSPLATDNFTSYGCTEDALDGPELTYVIPASPNAVSYTATLASQTGGHRLARLSRDAPGACDATDCVEMANTLEWISTPGETTHLIVDSSAEHAGDFALQLHCDAGTEFDCANGIDENGNRQID